MFLPSSKYLKTLEVVEVVGTQDRVEERWNHSRRPYLKRQSQRESRQRQRLSRLFGIGPTLTISAPNHLTKSTILLSVFPVIAVSQPQFSTRDRGDPKGGLALQL